MGKIEATDCRLAIGAVVLALECDSADHAASLREYFATGLSDATPDLVLHLEVLDGGEAGPVPNSLVAVLRPTADGFVIGDDLVTGSYDPVARRGELRVPWYLLRGRFTRVFEQLLYQAFYSARDARRYPAVLVHASGVARAGDGFLFVGASGTGKSTVADLSRDHTVLNDEICLVEFAADGPVLFSTPFNGLYRHKCAGRVPLRAIFLLAHGAEHRLVPLGAADAVAAVTGQVVAPVPLAEPLTPGTSAYMLEYASRLVATTPVRRLVFAPDPSFWRVVDEAFPPLGGPS